MFVLRVLKLKLAENSKFNISSVLKMRKWKIVIYFVSKRVWNRLEWNKKVIDENTINDMI